MDEKKKPKRKQIVKAAKDKNLFDPSEFARDKHPIQAWETRKGKQPEWVKQQYGANEAAG